jgi:hypothetical protein
MLASAALPAFAKYMRRARTTEAVLNLRKMYDGAAAYYVADHTDALGVVLPRDFPATVGPTPAVPPAGGKVALAPSAWSAQGWHSLNFSVDDPQAYSYTFARAAPSVGLVMAQGDLDGDGIYSLFQRSVTGTPEGVSGGSGLHIANDIE